MYIHLSYGRTKCAFCGANINSERINDLESHFSTELNKLKTDIKFCIDCWNKYILEVPTYMNILIYYDEFKEDILIINDKYSKFSDDIRVQVEKYIKILEQKNENPFNTISTDKLDNSIITIAKNINNLLIEYSNIILDHNKKTETFEESTKNAKKIIERHYVQEQINELSYKECSENCEQLNKQLEQDRKTIDNKTNVYNILEKKISNQLLGVKEFNEMLEKFLGYDELKIQFDNQAKGYKLYRNMELEASNMSEGEKTAIAFIYYIIKLKENGRKIEDTILVIDDPISSFDSNKLFTSYAYMKSECCNAKQLFVLTHNYNYFSLVYNWFRSKRKKDPKTGNMIQDYSIYRIENHIENNRRVAIINNGGDSLKQTTEYDYVFYTVYSMKDRVLTKQEMIFCGNVCRKLVESFLSFKFPKQRDTLMNLLNAALPGKEKDIIRERIYRFINIYSHEDKINVFEELDTEILDANSGIIINDILSMIENLDKNHYDAMVDKSKKEIQ